MILSLIAAMLASSVSPTTSPAQYSQTCVLPGLRTAIAEKPTRFIVFGEPHGTVEIPLLFRDAVCDLSQDRSVVVALEIEDDAQAVIDKFLSSDGTVEDQRELASAQFWRPKYPDGRSSVAIMALLNELRALIKEGRPIKVLAFRNWDTVEVGAGYMEIDSAARLVRAAAVAKESTVVVLTGSFHARRSLRADVAHTPMVGILPRQDVLNLSFYNSGGEHWGCRDTCGRQPLASGGGLRTRGVVLSPVEDGDFDGSYAIGGPATAALPVSGITERVTPLPLPVH